MSQYKFNKCAQEITNEIYKDSIDNKIYLLGYAEGLIKLYKMLESCLGENEKKLVLEKIKETDSFCNGYINRLLGAYDSENSDAETFAEKYEEYKDHSSK